MPDSELQLRIHKRASQACQQCRLRKVKCDLVEVGLPCDNCRSDGAECVASTSRRSRKYRLQKSQSKHVRAVQPLLLPQPQPTASSVPFVAARPGDASRDPATPLSCEYDSVNTLSLDGTHIHSSFGPSLQSPRQNLPTILPAGSLSAREPIKFRSLPSYIRPPHYNLRPDELDFLESRGALTIPDRPVRDELLFSFLHYVNPFLPVLDVQEFLSAIEGESGSQVSLILLQAVMFAGTAFVDSQVLLDAGFKDRTTARAYFFQKVKARRYDV
jgi:hypothetical protein